MLERTRALRTQGILGMNRRNLDYIQRYNKRAYYPLVDNKLLTKKCATAKNIIVPDTYGVISSQREVKNFPALIQGKISFVIKPAQGAGGKGILVIPEHNNNRFIKPSGEELSIAYIKRHLSNLITGLYSLSGKPDVAIIEEMIQFDPILDRYTYEGVPDIRIIVFRGIPVMAMLRCATTTSDGKANLHQGAVGIGLNMATGATICAVQFNRIVHRHPDTQMEFSGLRIPDWPRLLELAVRCGEMTPLNYIGCDFVLDKNKGSVLLEINARPGLAIQIANQQGLRHRLKKIEALNVLSMSAQGKVEYALKLDDTVS